MPEKRGKTGVFLEYCEQNNLKHSKELIIDDNLCSPVMEDTKESKKHFEDLKSMKITLYKIENKN